MYEAEVKIDGKVKNDGSTFFPKDWTPQQVIDAITEAFSSKRIFRGNSLYEGKTSGGIKIQMYVVNGKITSAWPIYE